MVDVFAGVVKLMKRDRAQHIKEIAKLDAALAALGGTGHAKRKLSAEARERIAAAQRKRWAKVRKQKA